MHRTGTQKQYRCAYLLILLQATHGLLINLVIRRKFTILLLLLLLLLVLLMLRLPLLNTLPPCSRHTRRKTHATKKSRGKKKRMTHLSTSFRCLVSRALAAEDARAVDHRSLSCTVRSAARRAARAAMAALRCTGAKSLPDPTAKHNLTSLSLVPTLTTK